MKIRPRIFPRPMLECPTNSPVHQCETIPCAIDQPLRPGTYVVRVQISLFGLCEFGNKIVEEQAWISDPWCRRITRLFAKYSPVQGLDLGTAGGPRIYPQLPSHESAVGEYVRVLRQAQVDCPVVSADNLLRGRNRQPAHDQDLRGERHDCHQQARYQPQFSELGNLQPRLLRSDGIRDRSRRFCRAICWRCRSSAN